MRACCRGSCRQDSVVSKQAQAMAMQRTTEQNSTVQYSVQHNKAAQCREGQTTEQSRTVQGKTGAGAGSRSTVQCGHALGPTTDAGKTGTQTQVLLHRRHPRPAGDKRGHCCHYRDQLEANETKIPVASRGNCVGTGVVAKPKRCVLAE